MKEKIESPNEMNEFEVKPVRYLRAENLFPYDFLRAYSNVFPDINEYVSFSIPDSIKETQEMLKEIVEAWDEIDAPLREQGMDTCAVSFDDREFTHITTSNREISYDYREFELSIDFGASAFFASKWLHQLMPLLRPETWRGIGGGNISPTGEEIAPFKLFVSFTENE